MATSHQQDIPAAPAVAAVALLTLSVDNPNMFLPSLEGVDFCEDSDLHSCFYDSSPSSETPFTLTEFTLFLKLSAEIRLKVWAHAYAYLEGRRISILPPLVKVPTLLQVCYDSRKMGLGIYSRQKHGSINDIPSFVTIIDFEKDMIDFTARRDLVNPCPADSSSRVHLYETLSQTVFRLDWENNLMMYTIYHFPELCKHIKHLTVRSCYVWWLSQIKNLNVPRDLLSINGFFRRHFPALDKVITISSGQEEDPEYVGNLATREAEDNASRDLMLYEHLDAVMNEAVAQAGAPQL